MTRSTSAAAMVAALCIGWAGSLSAANAQVQEIRGRACIISVNAACAAEGWEVGACAAFRFSPPNMLGNGNATRLSLFWGEYTMNYVQNGSAIGNTYVTPRYTAIGAGGSQYPTPLTKWRVPLVQPANYSQPYVHILIDFTRFSDFGVDDPSLCNLRLRLTGQKRPDQLPSSAEAGVPALED